MNILMAPKRNAKMFDPDEQHFESHRLQPAIIARYFAIEAA